jgi:acyl-CoA synthetase (NDP forming)
MGGRRVVEDGELLCCFRAFIALARSFATESSDGIPRLIELEVNPFGFAHHRMIPLDGRGRLGELPTAVAARPAAKVGALLEPKSIAMVGVSAKRVNFARIILNNTLDCGFPKEHLHVIKEDSEVIDGVRCVPGVRELPEPVDLMVVSTASEGVPQLLRETIDGGMAKSLILIPGGMGETEGSRDLQTELREIIAASRNNADGGPIVLGGNCLGVRSRPGQYDTFFVPHEKLAPRRNDACTPTALITQSGAFVITRMSNLESINPALAITIGNQLDLTVADLLSEVGRRDDIQVIGVYMEGFNELDGLSFVRAVERVTALGKLVVFYKAGRTASGRSATAGHTASIAGDYDVCHSAVAAAGAIVVDTFKEFEQLLEIGTLFRDKKVNGRRIGVITNAGFEAVGMADATVGARYELEIPPLSAETAHRIEAALAQKRLTGLVNVRNPLDLNPMADERVYVECAEAMLADPFLDAVVVSIVPFTPELATLPEEMMHPGSLVDQLPRILDRSEKPLAVVIDAGPPYDQLARAIRRRGVPVFPACDQAIRSMGRYLCHKSPRDETPKPTRTQPRPRTDLEMLVLTAR